MSPDAKVADLPMFSILAKKGNFRKVAFLWEWGVYSMTAWSNN